MFNISVTRASSLPRAMNNPRAGELDGGRLPAAHSSPIAAAFAPAEAPGPAAAAPEAPTVSAGAATAKRPLRG